MECLQDLLPAQHMTFVGAGGGKGVWAQSLHDGGISRTLVEGDPLKFAALQRLYTSCSEGEVFLIKQVVAPKQEVVAFFFANLELENGLLAPESLRHLWPNLCTVNTEQVEAMTLASLLKTHASHQWLILDCLPVATMLQTSEEVSPPLDVVLARVVLPEEQQPGQLEGATLAVLARALPGFRQLALQSEHHPDIAYALFARDYQRAWKSAEQAQLQLQSNIKASKKLQTELLQEQELPAQVNKGVESNLAQITENLKLESLAKQASIKAQEQLQAELTHKQEPQAQLQAALEADLAKTAQVRDAEMQVKNNLQAQLKELEVKQHEAQQCQSLLDEVLYRAEVQLKLVEELLLSDTEQKPMLSDRVDGPFVNSPRNAES